MIEEVKKVIDLTIMKDHMVTTPNILKIIKEESLMKKKGIQEIEMIILETMTIKEILIIIGENIIGVAWIEIIDTTIKIIDILIDFKIIIIENITIIMKISKKKNILMILPLQMMKIKIVMKKKKETKELKKIIKTITLTKILNTTIDIIKKK